MTDTGTGFVERVEDHLTEQPLEQRLNRSEVGDELRVHLRKVVVANERVGEEHDEEQKQEEQQISGRLRTS